jgi:hypothetical protein
MCPRSAQHWLRLDAYFLSGHLAYQLPRNAVWLAALGPGAQANQVDAGQTSMISAEMNRNR